jgi:outer membrane receptor for ferric coprogen and ferric-rhodotorulic acid
MHGTRPDASCYLSFATKLTLQFCKHAGARHPPRRRLAGGRAEHNATVSIGIATGNGRHAQAECTTRRATARGSFAERRTIARARQASNPAAQAPVKPAMASTAERVSAGTKGFVASRASGATKTDAPIMSTPGSVAVITREEMDVRRAQSIRDLLRYAPGIYFSNDSDFRFQPLKACGFDTEQYLDGLRLQGASFGIARIDPWFLDRAEIITGPASVLYGAASPGGILNMVSKLRPKLPSPRFRCKPARSTASRARSMSAAPSTRTRSCSTASSCSRAASISGSASAGRAQTGLKFRPRRP